MKKLLNIFSFLPFVKKINERKYYATGFGTFILNVISKNILFITRGDMLVHFTSRVNNAKNIKINPQNASAVYLSFATSGGCYYQALNGIEIGSGTIWSYNCCFISSNHNFKDLTKHEKSEPISIGDNVWIGANCVILPAVRIGNNVIVGGGSVVTKSFPDNCIIAGNPAKVIAYRCADCGDKVNIETLCTSCNKIKSIN